MLIVKNPQGGFTLEQIDENEIASIPGEVRAFLNVRNELTRLPFLFDYYRRLGVDRFFVVDDHSTDGTRAWLLSQSNCHVFEPSNSFSAARAGVEWQNLMLDTFSRNGWALIIDADELLVYPGSDKLGIKQFCDYLDHEKANIFPAYLLDLYPSVLSEGHCISGKPFYDICPYYDKNYIFVPKIVRKNRNGLYPEFRVHGGPRLRKFYGFEQRRDFFSKAILKLWITINTLYQFSKDNPPHYAPALVKAPLVKWHKGFRRISNHLLEGPIAEIRSSKIMGALLHFKFFSDFHQKAISELERGEHFNGSQEYRRYLWNLKRNPDLTFMYPGSRTYTGPQQLLSDGLLETSAELENYINNLPVDVA